jgi:pyruvate dehydrogenase E1 component beta subunit
MPATPQDAYSLLISAVRDPNPVIFLEHRWLHRFEDDVAFGGTATPLGQARVVRKGKDITLAAYSHMVIESLRAAKELANENIDCEVVDMRSAAPIDKNTLIASVKKTGHFVALDTGHQTCGMSAELVAIAAESAHADLKKAPARIAMPDYPVPTSKFMANDYYPEAWNIAHKVMDVLGRTSAEAKSRVKESLERKGELDVPHFDFKGPF